MARNYESLPLFKFGNIRSKDSVLNFVYKDFDELSAEKYYRGNGFEGIGGKENIIFEGKIPNQVPEQRYVFSVWAFVKADLYPRSMLTMTEFDEETGSEIQRLRWQMNDDIRSFDKDWALIDTPFKLKKANSNIRFSITNSLLEEHKIYFDELQIRKQEASLFREYAHELMNNNRFFEYKKRGIQE